MPITSPLYLSIHVLVQVDESVIRNVADVMVASGLAALGYQYVNIDDCWAVDRHPNGSIIEDPVRFPSGMKGRRK